MLFGQFSGSDNKMIRQHCGVPSIGPQNCGVFEVPFLVSGLQISVTRMLQRVSEVCLRRVFFLRGVCGVVVLPMAFRPEADS